MEPIGTITQYFPFLDSESRNLMQSIMDDAENYHDFVMRLNDKVLNEEVTDLAVYFAIHHSALLLDMDNIEAVAKKYGKMLILRPNLFYASVHQGNQEDLIKVHESADEILSTKPDAWLELEMRFLKFEVDLLHYPKVLYDSSNLETIKKIVDTHPSLDFYNTMLYDYLREKALRDGDQDEVARCTEEAIRSAEKHNDVVRLAYYLRRESDYLQKTDRTKSKRELLKAKELMESLGNKAGLASVIYYLSKLEAIRGEYNLAIERNLEVIQIRELMDLPRGVYATFLSTLYNVIGLPTAGLEWGKYAEIDFESHPAIKPRAILNQAWSLVLLRKSSEAVKLIDSVRESILKSGIDILLGWLSFVSGVLEMYEGDYYAASKSFEDALDIYEEKGRMEFSIIILHHLAQLDVVMACTIENRLAKTWLDLLEVKAISDELIGVLGQVYLLKVMLAIHKKDDGELRTLISKIRSLGNEPGLDFLNEQLDSLLNTKRS